MLLLAAVAACALATPAQPAWLRGYVIQVTACEAHPKTGEPTKRCQDLPTRRTFMASTVCQGKAAEYALLIPEIPPIAVGLDPNRRWHITVRCLAAVSNEMPV